MSTTELWNQAFDTETPPVKGAFLAADGWRIPLKGTNPDDGHTELVVALSGSYIDATEANIIAINVPDAQYYIDGQDLTFEVEFNENVDVDTGSGTPQLALTFATGGTKYAAYASGTGTNILTFTYTVEDGLLDADGIALSDDIDLNSGTIQDAGTSTNTDVTFTASSIVDTTGVQVDSLDRTVSSATAPSGNVATDATVDITVAFNAAVLVDTTSGTPSVPVYQNDGTTQIGDAAYVSGTGTTDLLFQYTVVAGNSEATAVKAGADVALNSGSITDLAGESANVAVTFAQATLTGVTLNQ